MIARGQSIISTDETFGKSLNTSDEHFSLGALAARPFGGKQMVREETSISKNF